MTPTGLVTSLLHTPPVSASRVIAQARYERIFIQFEGMVHYCTPYNLVVPNSHLLYGPGESGWGTNKKFDICGRITSNELSDSELLSYLFYFLVTPIVFLLAGVSTGCLLNSEPWVTVSAGP